MKNEPVVIERLFDVPVETVWQAITDIEKMHQWYFPTLVEFEPEIGFETMFDVDNNGEIYPHIWKVTEVVPNKKISYEWKFGGYPGRSLVSFELFDENGITRLVLTHYNIESFEGDINPALARENFVLGWNHIIGTSLREYLENS